MITINWIPEPKIFSKKYLESTMKTYAREISRRYFKNICHKCGKTNKPYNLHAHHKNKNRWDNRIENLELLCVKCHFDNHNINGKRSIGTKRKISKTRKKLFKEGKIKTWNKGLTKFDNPNLSQPSSHILNIKHMRKKYRGGK